MEKITIGQAAPEFILPDQDGKNHSLSDYRGKWILLYFYPKDQTPGCIKEACSFRDEYAEFRRREVQILGVSIDSAQSHKKFAQKYALLFPLLVDEDKKVVNLYGVWSKKIFLGKEYMGIYRTSFLINPQGDIVKIYNNVNPATHTQEVLADLEKETTRK